MRIVKRTGHPNWVMRDNYSMMVYSFLKLIKCVACTMNVVSCTC